MPLLSGQFLRQKVCYPESFRFLWLWITWMTVTSVSDTSLGSNSWSVLKFIYNSQTHRLYAGSSNTVAPNSSQGFQVVSICNNNKKRNHHISMDQYVFICLYLYNNNVNYQLSKDQFGSHHPTLMGGFGHHPSGQFDHQAIRLSRCLITGHQGCISCGILVSGIRARGVSSEHMENIEMFSCSQT